MSNSSTPNACLWSDQVAFCKTLKQADVPLDQKWPLTVLYLRGVKDNPNLTEAQKSAMQTLLISLLHNKDFSMGAYDGAQRHIHAIITSPFTTKIQEITKEASELAKDVHSMLGQQHENVSLMAQKVDADLARGADPALVLTNLRAELKDVIAKIAQDADALMLLSRQDSLTGLANRRRFDEFLHNAVEAWLDAKVPVSMIMVDIDHFKRINDTFGHVVGDKVLQALAGQIQKILDPLDNGNGNVLAARYGGEEFAIVLSGDVAAQALVLAESIRKTAGKIAVVLPPHDNEGGKERLSVSVSAGVASVWEGWKGAYQANLVDFADKALYRAKSNGRNCTAHYLPESRELYEVIARC